MHRRPDISFVVVINIKNNNNNNNAPSSAERKEGKEEVMMQEMDYQRDKDSFHLVHSASAASISSLTLANTSALFGSYSSRVSISMNTLLRYSMVYLLDETR